MKIIKTTNGAEVKVDDEDYDFLNRHNWFMDHKGYVKTTINKNWFYMHRLVFGRVTTGMVVDHRDTDKLNNTKSNLRMATTGQNSFNTGKMPFGKTSEYVGINWDKDKNKWRAGCSIKDRHIHICYHVDEIEAARERDAFVYAIRGEFSFLNFPDEIPLYSVWEFPKRLHKWIE